jgi:Asp/Glu/hydantoin racemase
MADKRESVAIIHTSFALVEVLGALVQELLPDVRCINIVDDSLLADVMREGKVCTNVARRMCQYFLAAEEAKASVVLNACSTVSETVDIARSLLKIPIIKVDEPMAELAVQSGERIGVIATVPTTIGPTCRLIERKAKELKKQVAISSNLLEGGFELLMSGAGFYGQTYASIG